MVIVIGVVFLMRNKLYILEIKAVTRISGSGKFASYVNINP